MSNTVRLGPLFERQAKALIGKFPGLAAEFKQLFCELESHAPQGDHMRRFPMLWKVRLPIRCAKISKRDGLRLIMFLEQGGDVVLLMVYHKAEIAQPSDKEIKAALRELRP